MSFSRSDVSAKKHMARVSDLYRERVRSIKTVLFFIVSVSLLSGETVPTHPSNNLTKINLSVQQFLIKQIGKKNTTKVDHGRLFWAKVTAQWEERNLITTGTS